MILAFVCPSTILTHEYSELPKICFDLLLDQFLLLYHNGKDAREEYPIRAKCLI